MNRHDRRRAEQEKRRKLADAGFVTKADAIAQFADFVLHGAGEAPHVVLGPVVWGLDDGHDTKHWYFVVGSGDAGGAFRVDQLKIAKDDRDWAEEARGALMMEFFSRRPIVMHDFDDELLMARFCSDVWPGEKTRRIRESLRA